MSGTVKHVRSAESVRCELIGRAMSDRGLYNTGSSKQASPS